MAKQPIWRALVKSFDKQIKYNNHLYTLVAVKPNSSDAKRRERKVPPNYFTRIVEHRKEGIYAYGVYKSVRKRFG